MSAARGCSDGTGGPKGCVAAAGRKRRVQQRLRSLLESPNAGLVICRLLSLGASAFEARSSSCLHGQPTQSSKTVAGNCADKVIALLSARAPPAGDVNGGVGGTAAHSARASLGATHAHTLALSSSCNIRQVRSGKRKGRKTRLHSTVKGTTNATAPVCTMEGSRGTRGQGAGEMMAHTPLRPPTSPGRARSKQQVVVRLLAGRRQLWAARPPEPSGRHQEALLAGPLPQNTGALQPGGGDHPLARSACLHQGQAACILTMDPALLAARRATWPKCGHGRQAGLPETRPHRAAAATDRPADRC